MCRQVLILVEVLGCRQDTGLDVITESQNWVARVETRSQVFILLPQIAWQVWRHNRAGFVTVGPTNTKVEMGAICLRTGRKSCELSLSLKSFLSWKGDIQMC